MHSWAPFEWIAAVRFLREGRMQTLFIITGVAIGVAVIVFMSAMLSSLQANIIRRVLSAQAHIVLLPPQEVARPLRENEPGAIESAIIQRPYQRVRSINGRRSPRNCSACRRWLRCLRWPRARCWPRAATQAAR